MRGLAEDSLQLLKGALYDDHFPWLFEPLVWGSILGLFDLNNLGEAPRTGKLKVVKAVSKQVCGCVGSWRMASCCQGFVFCCVNWHVGCKARLLSQGS